MRRSLGRALSGAFVVGGAVAAGTALFVPAGPVYADGPAWRYLIAGTVLLELSVVWLLGRCWPRPGRPAGATVPPRRSLLFTGGLALAGALWAVPRAVNDLTSGLPGPRPALVAAGFLLLLAGVALGLPGSGAEPDALPRRPLVRGWLAGLLLVPVLVLADFAAVRLTPVRATTTDAVAAPEVPAVVGGVRWTWTAPSDPVGVVAAGAGAVVRLRDGLTALAGRDGAVRWTYRRPGTTVTDVVTTPDGSRLIAIFSSRNGGRHTLVVTFDAYTGAVLETDETVHDRVARPQNRVWLDFDPQRIRATWLEAGGEAWTWRAPDGCRLDRPLEQLLTRAGPVLLMTCADPARPDLAVGLDEATGRERWRTVLTRATDRERRSWMVLGSGAASIDASILLDIETGAVLYTAAPRHAIRVPDRNFPLLDYYPEGRPPTAGPDVLVHDVATGTDRPEPARDPATRCRSPLLTPAGLLRLCRTAGDTLRLESFTLPAGQPAGSAELALGGDLPPSPERMLTVAPGAVVAWSAGHRTVYGLA
ncbi:hypothetical protein [Dactylosporangium sp. NPDC051541]|uniref:hypothetical protein n=1 Tax=Dactylosporangium sp. NPDC051541 TaxID=3363977 RepID=UPI0037B4F9D9